MTAIYCPSMPAARVSRARLTRRASTARAAGNLFSAATQGLGLDLSGRFSLFVHGAHFYGLGAYESIRISRKDMYDRTFVDRRCAKPSH